VTRFPRGGKWQISTGGGKEPMWARDSRELFYRNGQKMMSMFLRGRTRQGRPQNQETAGITHVTLVQKWLQEPEQLVPAN